jgi:hypothetical protein
VHFFTSVGVGVEIAVGLGVAVVVDVGVGLYTGVGVGVDCGGTSYKSYSSASYSSPDGVYVIVFTGVWLDPGFVLQIARS